MSRAARRHERARDVRATKGDGARARTAEKKRTRRTRFFSSRDGRKETPTCERKCANSCQLSFSDRPSRPRRVAPREKLTDRRKATRVARAVRAAGASGRTRELGHLVAGHLLEPPSLRSSGCGAVGRRVSTGRSLGLVGRTHMAHDTTDARARASRGAATARARPCLRARTRRVTSQARFRSRRSSRDSDRGPRERRSRSRDA